MVISGGTSGITVDGDTNFFNPPATTQVSGVVKLASLDDIKAGTDSKKAVTPSGVFNFVKTYVTEAIEALKTLLRKEIAAAALAAVPIGTVIYYLGTEIPDGYLLTNGASVSKTDFSDLYGVIGDKFGNVDSAHFNLPNTHHRFLEGTTTLSEVGTYIEAGVPNIPVGSLPVISYNRQDPDLPFKVLSRYGDYVATDMVTSRYWQNTQIGFDLNASNSIFGASDTTQPESLRALCLIRSY